MGFASNLCLWLSPSWTEEIQISISHLFLASRVNVSQWSLTALFFKNFYIYLILCFKKFLLVYICIDGFTPCGELVHRTSSFTFPSPLLIGTYLWYITNTFIVASQCMYMTHLNSFYILFTSSLLTPSFS